MEESADEVDSENRDLQYASENAMKLFDDIESTIYSLDLRYALDSYHMAMLRINPESPILPHCLGQNSKISFWSALVSTV